LPTYEYACTACGHRLEAVQKFTDDALTECPDCGGKLRKVFGAPGIVLKGSGFYKTDTRAADKRSGSEKSSGSNGSDSSSGSDTKTDSTAKSSDSGSKDSSKSGTSSDKPAATSKPAASTSSPSTST
jgi:putative FmdB family regulatory protein